MRRYIYSISIAILFTVNGFAQSYGLTFNSHEVVQEKRTCLDLTPEDSLCLKKNFELTFDISFRSVHEITFGYIVRIIANNQNIDLIYNQPTSTFKVIVGENFSGISFFLDSLKLYKEWNAFALKFDLENHTLSFAVNGKKIGTCNLSLTGSCFKFLWGANDFQKFKTRDIPPMKVKDVKIFENDALKYFWPLDETSGDLCYDRVGRHIAKAKNPVWLKPKYQKWELLSSFAINGYSSVAYDPRQDKIYVGGSDSLCVFALGNAQPAIDYIPCRHQELILGHQMIYDTTGNRLYDIFVDRKILTSFDFERHQWDVLFTPSAITEYWHANKFVSARDTSLYYIAGYGQLKYKNLVQRYRFATKQWDSVKPSGDYFPPHYLSGLGADPSGKYIYIIGGYGSQTGDQMLDPRNYYDLFRYDIKARSFKRLYTLKTLSTPFTFANSLVIGPKAGAWYGLIFSNDSYNSSLQLIEGSLTDSAYHLAGDAIPYSFHDIQSFADLYYSPLSNKLIAVTLLYSKEFEKEKNTQVKIYSLDFPPEPFETTDAVRVTPGRTNTGWVRYLFISLILAGLAALYFYRRRYRRTGMPAPEPSLRTQAPLPPTPVPETLPHFFQPAVSSIFLFGQFQVFDREGQDSTRLFTPLLKELFLIIATYTIRNGRGISSEALNEILWHDKPEKDAKNNRSVNLAKLKIILEKIGNCVINKESGYWQFQVQDESAYVDYKKYVSLLQTGSEPGKAEIRPFLDIIKRGPFLLQTEYNWLDDIKSEVSNSVIDLCLGYIKRHYNTIDPELVIEITQCIFYFDQLNEDALIYKCKNLIILKRHTLANNTYQKFLKDYKDIYGTDFGRSFQEIIA